MYTYNVSIHCAVCNAKQHNKKVTLHSPVTSSLTVSSGASDGDTCISSGGGCRGGGGAGGRGGGGGGCGGGCTTSGTGTTTYMHPQLVGDGGHQVLYQLWRWC